MPETTSAASPLATAVFAAAVSLLPALATAAPEFETPSLPHVAEPSIWLLVSCAYPRAPLSGTPSWGPITDVTGAFVTGVVRSASTTRIAVRVAEALERPDAIITHINPIGSRNGVAELELRSTRAVFPELRTGERIHLGIYGELEGTCRGEERRGKDWLQLRQALIFSDFSSASILFYFAHLRVEDGGFPADRGPLSLIDGPLMSELYLTGPGSADPNIVVRRAVSMGTGPCDFEVPLTLAASGVEREVRSGDSVAVEASGKRFVASILLSRLVPEMLGARCGGPAASDLVYSVMRVRP